MQLIKRLINSINSIMESVPNCTVIRAVIIFIDKRKWKKKYHLMEQEYFQFEFYNLSKDEKREYVRDYEIMNNTFNLLEERNKLDDKVEFNKEFKVLIGREYCYLTKENFDEFNEFVAKYPVFMKKPINLYGGTGVEKVDSRNKDVKKLFEEIIGQGHCLIEEVLQQHEKMALLNTDSVNTIRVITMRDKVGKIHIPFANVRIGRKGKDVDNFCAGGITAGIDVKTGIIMSEAFDKNCYKYVKHPDTNVELKGFTIPCWDEIISTVKEAAEKLPNCRYIGWDVMVNKEGRVCLIEGNGRPEARLHQLAAHKGLRSEYEKYLGEMV